MQIAIIIINCLHLKFRLYLALNIYIWKTGEWKWHQKRPISMYIDTLFMLQNKYSLKPNNR